MVDQRKDSIENTENPLEGDQENLKVDTIEKGTGLVGDQEKGVIGMATENHHPQGTDLPVDREETTIDPLTDKRQKTID